MSFEKSIIGFCIEYEIPTDRIEASLKPRGQIPNGWLGVTWYAYDSNNQRMGKIATVDWFTGHNIALHAIAWHEFNHANEWVINGKADGHTTPWIKRVMRKPFLFIFGEIWAGILYIYLSAKHA